MLTRRDITDKNIRKLNTWGPILTQHMNHSIPYPATYTRDILSSVKTIALVGASPKTDRASYRVLVALVDAGYEVIPVNPRPGLAEIYGQKVYPTLASIDRPVDMIDVFRRSEFLMGVVKESIALNPKVIWSQLDVFDPDAANLAEENGIQVVMNRCPKIELTMA